MKLIEDIRNRIGRLVLERRAPRNIRRKLLPFHAVDYVGIVYDAGTRESEERVNAYANRLRSEGKRVFLMGYVDMKELPHTKKFNLQSEFFWKEKLDGLNLPIPGKIGRFLETDFDLLLNLYTEPLLPMQAISAFSHAKYRVGAHLPGGLRYYDAMIDTGERTDLGFLIEQIDFYLNHIQSA